MKISVVIPVYNEEKYIVRCLKSIINNTRKADEIIVVDGLSEDKTRKLISKFPEVKLLKNSHRTAASGRNVGISYAKGDIIAFTDGDCIVRKDWLENIEKAFENDNIDALGGKIKTAKFENKYERFWGNLAWNVLMTFGDEKYKVEKYTLNDAFVTANCAYKKELIEELEGFDEWFGNNAEDIDFSWRALKKGANMMYIPDVVIYAHSVTTLKGIRNKSFRNGISSSKLQKRYGKRFNYDWNIYKMWFENLCGCIKNKPDSGLYLIELTWHLLGKYYGSIKFHVFNI